MIAAQNKDAVAESKTTSPVFSYDDFTSKYAQYKKAYSAQKVIDSVTGQTVTVGDTIAEQEERAKMSAITDKKSAIAYVDSRIGDSAAQIFGDMYSWNVPFDQIRQAKNYLMGKYTEKEEREKIKSAYEELKNVNFENSLYDNFFVNAASSIGASIGGIFKHENTGEQDKWFSSVASAAESTSISSVSADDAKNILLNSLEYNEYDQIDVNSVVSAIDSLSEAGASADVIKDAVNTVFAGIYNATANDDEQIFRTAFSSDSDEITLQEALYYAVERAEDKDKSAIVEAGRAQKVGSGEMTDFEYDQMISRNGWERGLKTDKWAKDYYIESEYDRAISAYGSPEDVEYWNGLTDEQKREVANSSWESMSDDERASYAANFANGVGSNVILHKDHAKQLDMQAAMILPRFVSGLASSAINLTDMVFNRTDEQWGITKAANEINSIVGSYGKSVNQDSASDLISGASDVATELVRMYTLNAAGKSMFDRIQKLTGKTFAVSSTASLGAQRLQKFGLHMLRSTPFTLGATANYYSQAMQNGSTRWEAIAYAIPCGFLEGAVEQINIDSWVGKGLGSKRLASELVSGGKNAMKSAVGQAKLISLASGFFGEFGEESLSYCASWAMQNLTYNKGAKFDAKEMFDQGIMGGFVGVCGAGLSLGSYNAANIAAEYMAKNGYSSNMMDLMFAEVQKSAMTKEQIAQYSVDPTVLSLPEYQSTVRDIQNHVVQMEDGKVKHEQNIAKINSELRKKVDSVNDLLDQQSSIDVTASTENVAEWNKIIEALNVAQSELNVETEQAKKKIADENSAYKQVTAQHEAAISKAQDRLNSHYVGFSNLFGENIRSIEKLQELKEHVGNRENTDSKSNALTAAVDSSKLTSFREKMLTMNTKNAEKTFGKIGKTSGNISDPSMYYYWVAQ